MSAAVRDWRQHLVDLGGRNSLLWYRDLPGGTLDVTTAHPTGVSKLLAGHSVRLSELVRERAAYAEAVRRARLIRAKTTELAQERGISAGFLTIGMATWDVPQSYVRAPQAPVLLRRAILRPVDGTEEDFVVELGEDIELNPVLASYLESERGIRLDPQALVDLAHGGRGVAPGPLLQTLEQRCAQVPGFRVRPTMVLGTFSYAKLPMVADLAAQGDDLAQHDVIAAMAGDPEAMLQVQATAPPRETEVDPAQEWLVLDADSSQQAVIDAVCAGSHLVVKGPPGTGKSQTIANLIATLAGQGRRVLFVAEKRAAIDAVVGRLEQRGLGELVLDAHDGRPDRRELALSLTSTVDRVARDGVAPAPPVNPELLVQREHLLDHRRAMHEPREPWGVSADEAQMRICELAALAHPPRSHVRLEGAPLRGIPAVRRDELAADLVEAAQRRAWSDGQQPDPWYGARLVGADQTQRTRSLVRDLARTRLAAHRQRLDDLADRVGLHPPRTMLEADDQLELMSRVHTTLETFRPQLFEAPVEDLVAATGTRGYRGERDVRLGSVERRRLRKQARELLRPGQPPSDIHGVLVRAALQQAQWRERSGPGSRPSAPVEVPQVQRAHDKMREDLDWLAGRLEGTAEGNDLIRVDLDELQDRCERLAAADDRLAVVPRVSSLLERLRANGLGPVIDDFATRRVTVDRVAREFDFIWWTSVLDEISVRDATYGTHDGGELRESVRAYAEADRQHIADGAQRVRAAVDEQIRQVMDDFPEQTVLLWKEAAKGRRHLPVRDLLGAAPELMTSVRPCWAMSPLVVASVVPPGLWFDVVVFDEGSQVPPAQAISAISRAAQVVVAGDPKQLPPTSFFTSEVEDDSTPADLRVEGVQSVLDVLSTMLPTQELTWHYRSLDERLVAFANAQIYRGALVTFPGTAGDDVIQLDVVAGQAGDDKSSPAEVQRVVQIVLDHARRRPEESLGVITLGLTHARKVEAAVRAALAGAPDVAGFFACRGREPFFVKNLERVQGDERDAVVLSIGYGRRADGAAPHLFGPLNLDGGERRLNVAITRARRRMTVVSSFSADELDVPRLRARGALMLRDFLTYAASGGSADRGAPPADVADSGPAQLAAAPGSSAAAPATGGASRPSIVAGRRRRTASTGSVLDRPLVPVLTDRPVNPLVADLAARLRHKGLVVHAMHGISAHPLDLAIEDPMRPGELILAVETDGAIYAGMTSVRDRDRLRVEQLHRLGWAHERVWTVDVFRDPARDIARIQDTVHRLSHQRAAQRRAARQGRLADPQ